MLKIRLARKKPVKDYSHYKGRWPARLKGFCVRKRKRNISSSFHSPDCLQCLLNTGCSAFLLRSGITGCRKGCEPARCKTAGSTYQGDRSVGIGKQTCGGHSSCCCVFCFGRYSLLAMLFVHQGEQFGPWWWCRHPKIHAYT